MKNKVIKNSIIGLCSVAAVIHIVMTKPNNADLRISQKGLEIIGNAEGCRTHPYYCPANILTVGIGSTAYSQPIQSKRSYSLEEIAERWIKDIKAAEDCVNRFANGKILPQGAFDALVSITFNVGCGKLKQSTLFKIANNGYHPNLCNQLGRWVYSGGKKLAGLEIRRKKEIQLCLSENNK